MQPLIRAYVATANLVRHRTEAMRDDDRGQNTLEYAGLVVLIAGILGLIFGLGLDENISGKIETKVSNILNGGG